MKTPRAILFDLDGTLAHTAPDLVAATNHVAESKGLPLVPYRQLAPHASAGAAALLRAATGMDVTHAEFEAAKAQFLAYYEQHIAVHTCLFPGISQLLQWLEETGMPWGIVTNKPARYTNLLVPKIGLTKAGCIISGDTTPFPKPHPAPLLEGARQIGIPPEDCWYVGDDLRDMVAARAAGMTAVAAGWGYGEQIGSWDAVFVAAEPKHVFYRYFDNKTGQ